MQPYDDALEFILKNGTLKENRTGIKTLSVFGYQMRFDISTFFPILTKRKMYYNSIFKELLWIISGSTNVNDLEKMGSKIWSPWRDKEFEKRNGYNDGELGPLYAWQLRYFGAKYEDRHYFYDTNYLDINKGFDQLVYVVNELKTNPTSRRILFSYWNPVDVTTDRVKLPPCHDLFQLNCDNGNLSGILFQRSGDAAIGIPANVQFYSTLIYLLALECNFQPSEFIHSISDFHIYENHLEGTKEYLSRNPIDSPQIKIKKAKDIFSYKPEDFEVINYTPAETIKFEVAV